MGPRRVVAMFAMGAMLLGSGPAAADDSALNDEGFWSVGRGEADNTSCMASLSVRAGGMFILRAEAGEVWFAVGAKAPLRGGKTAELSTEAYSFDFTPSLSRGGALMADGPLNERALAALRLARGLIVRLDGREVFNADVQGTGLEGALDAAVACSQGKSGWWGPGVGAERLADGPVPNKKADDPDYNKEGIWAVAVSEDPGVCVAQAVAADHRHLQILAGSGQVGLAVGTDGEDLPRGRKGKVETDAYAFDFKPEYGADSYMAAAEPFDSQAIFALQRAKWIRVTVDGQELVDAALEDSGFADLLDSVAACSRGEKGWWGEGARRP